VEIEGRRYATQVGLASLLGVAPRTLARWDERRMGPPKIKIGNLVLYDLAKLHAWLESHERTAIDGTRRKT
jgi:phage terminase Nu1 subunit (DNA packaging protein)